MKNDDLNLYIMAELTYKNKNGNKDNLFPIDWYSSKNYRLKTEIIAEALKNNKEIENTTLYQTQFLEEIKIYKLEKDDKEKPTI